MSKMTSRKFWMAVAAFLGSIGASITGYFTDNEKVMIAGVVCTMLSAAIYVAMEAYVDGQGAAANMTYNEFTETKQISGSTASSIKAVVDTMAPQAFIPVVDGPDDGEE